MTLRPLSPEFIAARQKVTLERDRYYARLNEADDTRAAATRARIAFEEQAKAYREAQAELDAAYKKEVAAAKTV